MKKSVRILALLLVVLTLATTAIFADTATPFALDKGKSSPADGSNSTVPQNVAVKLIFTNPIAQSETQKANEGKVVIEAEDGTKIDYTALYNADKYPNEVWLQCNADLVPTATYTVTIPATFKNDAGETLGAADTISFTIFNTKRSNTVYMVLMIVMMIAMMVFTVRDAAKAARNETETKKGAKGVDKVNPYKEAKKSGKSVDEMVQKANAKKAKANEKAAKREAMKEEIRKEILAEREKARKEKEPKLRVKKKASMTAKGYKFPKAYVDSFHKNK